MRRDYHSALCIVLGAATAMGGVAAALASQADRFRELERTQLRAGSMRICPSEYVASDLDGDTRRYGLGSSAVASIEDLETRIDERKE